ncbi:MAG: hypothetical protein LC754_11835 [Acidobacteria bacterium]|nr:hypothetical protein [Acidobacteriota bacterium]
MKFDWQTFAVALIILAACLYVGRRGLARLRSFRRRGENAATECETGCGSCGGAAKATTKPATVLVQINPTRR